MLAKAIVIIIAAGAFAYYMNQAFLGQL